MPLSAQSVGRIAYLLAGLAGLAGSVAAQSPTPSALEEQFRAAGRTWLSDGEAA